VTHENAHNQFLQFAAELGAVGLVAFLLVLWSALTLSSALTWQVSAAAALSAFLITCLAGHPLLMPLVAYPFWMMVGVTAGGQRASPGELAALRRGVLVVIIALVATMPLRWGA
jgi:O-antigen ligase